MSALAEFRMLPSCVRRLVGAFCRMTVGQERKAIAFRCYRIKFHPFNRVLEVSLFG